MDLKQLIEKTWEDRSLLQNSESQDAIRSVVEKLDKGELRVAEPVSGGWQVNEWIKKAVILYFPIQQMETIEVGRILLPGRRPSTRSCPRGAPGVRGEHRRAGEHIPQR